MIAAASALLSFVVSPIGRVIGIGLVALAVAGGIWKSGYNYASRKCEAAALRAELQGVRIERDAANARAERSAVREAELAAIEAQQRDQVAALQAEIDRQPPQSTKQGAKHDPKALYDDRCNLTGAGARRLR